MGAGYLFIKRNEEEENVYAAFWWILLKQKKKKKNTFALILSSKEENGNAVLPAVFSYMHVHMELEERRLILSKCSHSIYYSMLFAPLCLKGETTVLHIKKMLFSLLTKNAGAFFYRFFLT